MENTLLTVEEIIKVQNLVAKKGYSFVDVQHEIMDHVLCAIEDKRKADPSIRIEQAFHEVHASFGIFGFSGIEEAMQLSLQKKLWNDMKLTAQSLFTSDKFALVVLFALLPYALIHFFGSLKIAFIPYFLVIAASVIHRIYAYRRRPGARKFLAFQMAFSLSLVSFPMGYWIFSFAFDFTNSAVGMANPSIVYVLLPILCLFEVVSILAFRRAIQRANQHISKYGLPAQA